MNGNFEQHFRSVMGGSVRGIGPALLRGATAIAEPFYSGIVRARNGLYDVGGIPTRTLPRPVISIGNITTGGTGKTPAVRWLADRLRSRGKSVAILSRGYRSEAGGLGDELEFLKEVLNSADGPRVHVYANPDRFAGGQAALREHPEINVFLLDDGFQHRRLARDLDVVLINAAVPFGLGHVLPRGFLREPLVGLRRAQAVLLTHVERVDEIALSDIESKVRRYNSTAPIYRSRHVHIGLFESDSSDQGPVAQPMEALSSRPFFAFCGIGDPDAFRAQLARLGDRFRGHAIFSDHHSYSAKDLKALQQKAVASGAEVLVVTEKDWVKVGPLIAHVRGLPVWRIAMELQFDRGDEADFFAQVESVITRSTSAPSVI